MKIISKYKDYYDYLQGIYGIDQNKIFQRTNIIEEQDFDLDFEKEGYYFYLFAINNKIYSLIRTSKGFSPISENTLKLLGFEQSYLFEKVLDLNKTKTEINKETRKPIVMAFLDGDYEIDWIKDKDPLMQSFSFHKILSAKDLYIEVETFLGWIKDNPPIPNNQTNKEKIISKGFDMKISFRHRKNN
ncbi:MAG: hypothetical protein L3J08_08085 [Flavobacteriaceae bacterium]|nr:hypothetical protein [Flavobacteriaceae bacterium]